MFDADLGKKLLWFKNKLFKKEKRKKHLGKATPGGPPPIRKKWAKVHGNKR